MLSCMKATAVFAPLLRALNSPRLSMQEQAYLRSTIVDGQWTQLRKYLAAGTLLLLFALCGSEGCSLVHRTVVALKCKDRPQAIGQALSTRQRSQDSCGSTRFTTLLLALSGRPPGCTVPSRSAGKPTEAR